jgi:hypothetical protein
MSFQALKKGHQPGGEKQALRETDLGSRIEMQGGCSQSRKDDHVWDGDHHPLKGVGQILEKRWGFIQLKLKGMFLHTVNSAPSESLTASLESDVDEIHSLSG